MQSLQVDHRFTTAGAAIEHRSGTVQKLRFPLRDLIRMNVEALRKVRKRRPRTLVEDLAVAR